MKVAIDAHMVGTRETGNETYMVNLIRALKGLDAEVDYQLYVTNPAQLPDDLQRSAKFQVCRLWPSSPMLRIPLSMPYAARRHSVDLLHVNYVAPPWCPCPTVVTVHDISYEYFPEFFSPRDRFVLSRLVPPSVRKAAKVIAVSEHTKRDLVERYGVDENRITVTYEAASDSFRPIKERARVESTLREYSLEAGYILSVGNLQPRKNLVRLVEAYGRLRGASTLRHKLVIVGQVQWRGSEIGALARKLGLDRDIVFTGYVPDQDLPALYCGAELLAYPSLYEGFGLPPLEAMASGIPVICSNTTSLPEVVGDAAILVDPYDVEGLAASMQLVLTEPDLRADLVAKGIARAKRFSWEDTARRTLAVYRDVCASG